ncbi:MAG: glycosyltransferase family 10 [Simkaniaceae bacterium]|nr:glycosyltransferase family 10 [Simkaniaceae bacterium]
MRSILLLLILFFPPLFCGYVDVVQSFDLREHAPNIHKLLEGSRVRLFKGEYTMQGDVDWVVFDDMHYTREMLSDIPKEKRIYIAWEPIRNYKKLKRDFSRIYTYRSDMHDNVTCLPFAFPNLRAMIKPVNFWKKKLCVMITRNGTGLRKRVVRFFDTLEEPGFDLYGRKKIETSRFYRGPIPGCHSTLSKVKVNKEYRFSFCIENTALPGYISEKVFNAFHAATVPIYWGAPDVTRYIPQECFIDMRKFPTLQALYDYLQRISEEEYDLYLKNIEKFIRSSQAQIFSEETFAKLLKEM